MNTPQLNKFDKYWSLVLYTDTKTFELRIEYYWDGHEWDHFKCYCAYSDGDEYLIQMDENADDFEELSSDVKETFDNLKQCWSELRKLVTLHVTN
jgi:hypothetical protein